MEINRRSLIIGATGVAAGSYKIVPAKAADLVTIPYNVQKAQRWATERFNENPAVRLVFANGSTYSWFRYDQVVRNNSSGTPSTYAVAIEVSVTDPTGHRSIHTIPVDGFGLYKAKGAFEAERNAAAAKRRAEFLALRKSVIDDFDF